MESKPETDVLKAMQGKMMADWMLDEFLSKLSSISDVEAEVMAVLQLIAAYDRLSHMMDSFLIKIKDNPSYLAHCSSFHKRILLFRLVNCVFVGKDLTVTFGNNNESPLEYALFQLDDIAVSFQNDMAREVFVEVWMQTLKQAIFVYLRNNNTISASAILVVHRDEMSKENSNILQNIINHCEKDKNFLSKVDTEEHSFEVYWKLFAELIQDLNNSLCSTTLHQLAQKIKFNVALINGEFSGGEDFMAPTSSRTNGDCSENKMGQEEEGRELEQRATLDGETSDAVQEDSIEDDIGPSVKVINEQEKNSENDELSSARMHKKMRTSKELFPKSRHSKGLKENPKKKSFQKPISDEEDSDELNTNSTNPRNCLNYRIKRQTKKSGIIIPCKRVISFCQKINNEVSNEIPQPERKKLIPGRIKSSPILKSYKTPVVSRNLLLGERFEDAKQKSSKRTYTTSNRLKFTVDLDMYIVAGCKIFGVGQWSEILKTFPFPTDCTNIKIKDRFRTLIKWKYVACLDDGELNILNKDLHLRVPGVIEDYRKKEKELKTENSLVKKFYNKPKKQMEKRPSTDTAPLSENSEDNLVVMDEVVKFSLREDAYIVCGVRHCGFNWNQIKGYFNFNEKLSKTDLKERFRTLIKESRVLLSDDHEVTCRDSELELMSQSVKKELQRSKKNFKNQKKVREKRKSYEAGNACSSISSEESFVSSVKKRTSKRQQQINSEDSNDDVQELPTSSPKRWLNTSNAGTQTKRKKFLLRETSPEVLGADSDSVTESSEGGRGEFMKVVGTPLRPTRLNHFKTGVGPVLSSQSSSGKKGKGKVNPALLELRNRRKKELLRKQRQRTSATRTPWTGAEIKALMTGLEKHGPGKWSQILDDGWDVFQDRTSVMIKDKFRTLLKKGVIPEDVVLMWDAQKSVKD